MIYIYREQAFLTIKDHKSDFPTKVNFRLTNPMKNPTGRVSKKNLARINFEIRNKTEFNQWRSTKE